MIDLFLLTLNAIARHNNVVVHYYKRPITLSLGCIEAMQENLTLGWGLRLKNCLGDLCKECEQYLYY